MKFSILIVSVVIITGASGIAWHEAQLTRDAIRQAGIAVQQQRRIDVEIHRVGQRLAELAKEREELRSALAALQKGTASVASAADSEKTASIVAQFSEYLQKQFEEDNKDPALRAIKLESARAKLVTTYGVLFRSLYLSPAQVEKFQDIAANREERNQDLNDILGEEAAAQNNILSAETWAAVGKLKARTESEYKDGMRALLGESGYPQLQEYDLTIAARNMASGFAAAAVMAEDPLTAEQAERFTQVLAKASANYRSGGAVSWETIDWSLVNPEARQIFSESQWTLITTVEPPTGGRLGGQYYRALNAVLRTDSESKRGGATKQPGG